MLSKTWDFISFIDDNTAWTQPRLIDKEMHKQAGYKKRVNGTDVALGMKSQIIGVSLKDNPHKVRGKAGELIFFEEAGSFSGLLTAWEIAMPTMKQGSKTLGTMIAFGTGGEEGHGFESLEELFYHPEAYNCLAFENEWDAGAMGTTCGYFVPIYQNLDGFMDENGNSMIQDAKDFEEAARENKKKANDPKALDQYTAEHPFTPQEATLQTTINVFDVTSLKEQYNRVKAHNLEKEGTAMGTTCGYFVPIYQNLDGFMDENGNSMIQDAKDFEEAARENKKKANDPKALDQYTAEHPFTPQEATLQTTINVFDVTSLKEQYNRVKAHNLEKEGTAGVLFYKAEEVNFRPDPSVKPITKFPHRKDDNLTGGVVIYQNPYKTKEGNIPHNLYIVCHDPYAQGKSTTNQSLGAAYVIKRPNNLSKPDDIIVASYVGRPETQDEFNRNLFMLADYYNAKIGFENDRGELIAYAKRYRKLHKLQEEFEMLDKRELRSRNVRRQYGMHMTEQRKRQGELYIRDWLISPRSADEDGNVRLNLHEIYDIGLLQELIKFNHKGNFDRVMAFMIGMYHTRELYNKEVTETINDMSQNEWFDRNYK